MSDIATYRVLVLGGLFSRHPLNEIPNSSMNDSGSSHTTTNLKHFVDASNHVVLSLGAPMVEATASDAYQHPMGGPESTIEALRELNVDAVSLANERGSATGPDGLHATFQALTDSGIEWFGAGRSLSESQAPYKIRLPQWIGGGEVHFHGSLQHTNSRSNSDDTNAPGCAPLRASAVSAARTEFTPTDSLQVAFPHWGAKRKWRDYSQYTLAHRFLNKDYDLVLGHGGHGMQEIHRKQQRWVVYGIGDGGHSLAEPESQHEQRNETLPCSLWAVLEVRRQGERRWVTLKLYPVKSDTDGIQGRSGPVSTSDFKAVLNTLASRPIRPWRFDNPAQEVGADELGNFIALELGNWDVGARPARLKAPLETGDPGDWPLRSPSALIEDKVLSLDKHLGASMQVLSAEEGGGTARWVSGDLAVIDVGGKRMLARDYRAHESALGGAIVSDKVLTAELLEANGVATPKTIPVESAEEAVEAAKTLTGPVVVKPRNGNKSKGVSTGLLEDQEIRNAFAFARKHGTQVIVQQHIELFEELRVMASREGVLAVNGRELPHVVGDGVSTIGQLIEDKNLQRTLNPSLRNRPIPVDQLTYRQLEKCGLSLDSVPKLGQRVTVRNVAGLSVGGDTKQILETTAPEVKDAATAAIAAIPGLQWGGVDVVIEKDTHKPYVLEINTNAAYGAALFPAYGQPRDVGSAVWKLRYAATDPEPQGTPGIAEHRTTPVPLVSETDVPLSGPNVPFSNLFEKSLVNQGFKVQPENWRIWRVISPEGKRLWVTLNGRTAADRSVVRAVLQNHRSVHHLLALAHIPQPRARRISATEELKRFMQGRVSKVILNRASASWMGPNSKVVTEQNALEMPPLKESMWVQARVQGLRVRVLATRNEACVATASANQKDLDERYTVAASGLAVEAIRAIPELKWAAVDIVLRTKRIDEGQSGGALVEGLSLAPDYSLQDRVIAGDFDTFCRSILKPSFATQGRLATLDLDEKDPPKPPRR